MHGVSKRCAGLCPDGHTVLRRRAVPRPSHSGRDGRVTAGRRQDRRLPGDWTVDARRCPDVDLMRLAASGQIISSVRDRRDESAFKLKQNIRVLAAAGAHVTSQVRGHTRSFVPAARQDGGRAAIVPAVTLGRTATLISWHPRSVSNSRSVSSTLSPDVVMTDRAANVSYTNACPHCNQFYSCARDQLSLDHFRSVCK